MARVAALYDIHGNLPALDAVLEEVLAADVDLVVVGGDVVPGPMPNEVFARLVSLEIPVRYIHGNGDREILNFRAGRESPRVRETFLEVMRWTARQLEQPYVDAMASWPETVSVDIPGLGATLFCHATPRNDTEIFTVETPEVQLTRVFASVDEAVVICGHTHMQFDRMIGRHRVINAGSIGMPFGEPGAYWLLLGPDVELRRSPYDYAAAAAIVSATGHPEAERFATSTILEPPGIRQMLDTFALSAIRK